MRTPTLLAILTCAAATLAPTKFTAPVVGIVRDAQRELRLVDGVSGTFILRNTIAENTVDWAFDGNSGMAETAGELLTLGPDGAVVARAASQRNAILGPRSAFFPDTSELWQGNSRVSIEAAMIAGNVIAIQDAELAVCRANTLWLLTVDAKTGAVLRETVPGGTIGMQACATENGGPLVLTRDRMFLAAGHAVLVETMAGVERSLPISASHLARAGEEWIEAESAGQPAHMIHMTRDGEQVYELPGRRERP